MINQMDNLRYRMTLELIRRKMEKKEVKPIRKADNEEKPKKDGKYI